MKDAEADTLFVEDTYAEQWNNFWQAARKLKEQAANHATTPDARKLLWVENAKALGEHLHTMKKLAQTLV